MQVTLGTPATQRFSGWVPTITGHLSFSLIGRRGDEPSCVAYNVEVASNSGTPQRFVIVSQKRVTRDVPAPFRYFFPARIKEYILIGEAVQANRPDISPSGTIEIKPDQLGALTGDVLVVPRHRDRVAQQRARRLKKYIRNTIITASSLSKRQTPNPQELIQLIRAEVDSAGEVGTRVLRTGFTLHRTGELQIEIDDQSPPYFAEQVYFFVKDISHRHYHHSRSSDNILPLTQVHAYDDEGWRRDTLWALARAVLEARRRDKLDAYKSALGILAYAEAFQGLLAQVRWGTDGEDEFVKTKSVITYDFKHTRASLEAKIGESEYLDTSKSQLFVFILTTFLATAALWIGAVQIADPVCKAVYKPRLCPIVPSRGLSWLANNIITDPYWAGGVFLLITLLYLGRRAYSVDAIQHAIEFAGSWAQALGATLSRRIRSRLSEASDIVATYITAAIIFGLGSAILWGIWITSQLLLKMLEILG